MVDDASDPPVDGEAAARWAADLDLPLDLLRLDTHAGTTTAKNLAADRASTFAILSLDDDAFLVDGAAVPSALDVLEHDRRVAAVAFAQADERGAARPPGLQPAGSSVPCYVPAFIGFACLVVRERLVEAGGYRAEFVIHGEEREIALRWLDAGYRVVYLPGARVAHVADTANRDARQYARYVIRNDCLNALYNEPLPRLLVSIPVRLRNFTRMARRQGGDPGGVAWIVRQLAGRWPAVRQQRRPVRWRTLRLWRELRLTSPPYRTP